MVFYRVELPYKEKTVLKGPCIAPYVEIYIMHGDMHKQEKYFVRVMAFALRIFLKTKQFICLLNQHKRHMHAGPAFGWGEWGPCPGR
jgi:hypothetical protein